VLVEAVDEVAAAVLEPARVLDPEGVGWQPTAAALSRAAARRLEVGMKRTFGGSAVAREP
jgi:hypothetical protein